MKKNKQTRRRFLQNGIKISAMTAVSGGVSSVPMLVPGSALGLDGTAPASEKIILGGIGIN
ncbi:MAG: twin-arginine translocation signal domain-containing protein, partial [Thermoguttaceae bacterium]|nr:twin-arginine translocation signal domain-containing protein [Thermoguttaceae bacterium]